MSKCPCIVCGGNLKARIVQDGPIIFGPGNRTKIDGYYCSVCGLKYSFAPSPKLCKSTLAEVEE